MEGLPLISIIVPAINEAATLPATLTRLRTQSVAHEVIVAVGPNYDGTASIAEESGCVVVECARRHRAEQMNLAAARAQGAVLLFLHADTVLAEGALGKIADALADSGVVGGGFARRYETPSPFLRMTCRLAELRSRTLGIFLGDQAIFVRHSIFNVLGGFREIEIFDDFDFSQRMRRAGRTVTLRPPVVSAARRFYPRGPVITTARDFLMTCKYLAGVSPRQLALKAHRRGTRLRSIFIPAPGPQR